MYSHDIDLDSNTDIVFVQSNGSDLDSLVIAFDPFNKNNSYQVQEIPLCAECSTGTGRGMLFEDFDNNGLDDICFLGSDNKVRVILNMSPVAGINNFQTQLTQGLVYPNPTNCNFSIDLGESYPTTSIIITDLLGKTIQTNEFTNNQILNLKIEEPAGIYLLMIESGDKKAVIRLIKE